MKNILKLTLLSIILAMGCSEPIDLKVGLTDPKVVIDGYISDQFKVQKIALSYSSTFYQTGNNIFVPLPIKFATVKVTDDLSNEYIFIHFEKGVYLSQPFKAEDGRMYKLTVDVEGEIFESSFETLPENSNQVASVDIAFVSRKATNDKGEIVEEEGVQAFAMMQKTMNKDHFIWAVNHHFAVQTFSVLCYAKDFDLNDVIIVKDTEADGNVGAPYKVNLSFNVPSYKTNIDFAIDATLLTVNEKAFDYWRNIKDQIDRTGGLFDANSNTIQGNVVNISSDNIPLGFFGVYREVENYYFYNQTDLPIEQDVFSCPGQCINCESIPSDYANDVKPSWWR